MPTPAPTYGVTRLRPGKSTYALAKTFCDERLPIRSSARWISAVQLRKGVAGRARHRRGLIVRRLPMEPFRLDAQSPTEPVAGRQSRQDAGGAIVGGLPPRARPAVRIGAPGDLRETGVNKLVTAAGSVGAVAEQRHRRRDVEPDLLAQIEARRWLRRGRAGGQSGTGESQHARAEERPPGAHHCQVRWDRTLNWNVRVGNQPDASVKPQVRSACVVNGRLRHTGQGAVRRAPRCVVSRV